MKRVRIMASAMSMLLALMLVGCGSGETSEPDPTPDPTLTQDVETTPEDVDPTPEVVPPGFDAATFQETFNSLGDYEVIEPTQDGGMTTYRVSNHTTLIIIADDGTSAQIKTEGSALSLAVVEQLLRAVGVPDSQAPVVLTTFWGDWTQAKGAESTSIFDDPPMTIAILPTAGNYEITITFP